jgi:HEPN domain-containing protein
MTPHREEALRSLRMADHDIAAFEALGQHPEVHPAMSCFHAQQAIEKCLKAVLFARLVEFRRTHDLTELSDLLARNGVQIPVSSKWLESLNPFAVAFRYEEPKPSGLDTAALADVVRKVRKWAGELVG